MHTFQSKRLKTNKSIDTFSYIHVKSELNTSIYDYKNIDVMSNSINHKNKNSNSIDIFYKIISENHVPTSKLINEDNYQALIHTCITNENHISTTTNTKVDVYSKEDKIDSIEQSNFSIAVSIKNQLTISMNILEAKIIYLLNNIEITKYFYLYQKLQSMLQKTYYLKF